MRPFTGYPSFKQFIQAHTNDIAKTLQKAISEQSPSICGRVFNGLAWREDMDLSIKLFNAAQGIPALDDLGSNDANLKQAKQSLHNLPQLNAYFTQIKHRAADTLFDSKGNLKAILYQNPTLKPLLDKIYNTSSMDTNKVKKQFLVSYCLSFVLSQAVEIDSTQFTPDLDENGDFIIPDTLSAQRTLTLLLNDFANNNTPIASLCQAVQNKKRDELLSYYKWAQYCAKHASKDTARFLRASQMLNIAVHSHLGNQATPHKVDAVYQTLANNSASIIIPSQSTRAINAIINGLSLIRTTAPSANSRARQTRMCINALTPHLTHFKRKPSAPANKTAARKFCEPSTQSNSLYKAWVFESNLGKWHFRWSSLDIFKIDLKLYFLERKENQGATPAALLEKTLLLKQNIDQWITRAKRSALNKPANKTRLPAAIKLQSQLQEKCIKLEKKVHQNELNAFNQKEAAAYRASKQSTSPQPMITTTHASRQSGNSQSLFQPVRPTSHPSTQTQSKKRNASTISNRAAHTQPPKRPGLFQQARATHNRREIAARMTRQAVLSS